jgi:hypothetical protein
MSEMVSMKPADLDKEDRRMLGAPIVEPVTEAELRKISAGFPGSIGGSVW